MGKIIDISYWQTGINIAKIAADTEYIIMRASCGTAKDQNFAKNAKAAQENGVPFGAYHYVMALGTDRAKQEAEVFYNAAKNYHPTVWAVDVEHPPLIWADGQKLPMNPNLCTIVKAFVARLRALAGDQARIVLYTGESIYAPEYGNLGRIPWDALWFAAYGSNNGKIQSCPKTAHDLHQYTSKGRVDGYSGNVDLSHLSGDKPLEWWTEKTVTEIETPPAAADDPTATPDMETVNVDANGDGKIVRVTEPYAWHVRAGDGTGYDSLMIAYQGYEWDYVATSVTGWIAVRLTDGRIGWITPKAVEVVTLN